MPNIAQVLKTEIARIAAKQAKAIVAPIRKSTVAAKTSVASLKRLVAALEKASRQLQGTVARLSAAQPAPEPEVADKARITAKGMRSLRRKLGLSGDEMGKLLGITAQAVYHMEKGSSGALRVRAKTRAAILAIRELSARDAREMLVGMPAPKKAKKPAGKRGRGRSVYASRPRWTLEK